MCKRRCREVCVCVSESETIYTEYDIVYDIMKCIGVYYHLGERSCVCVYDIIFLNIYIYI